MKPNGSPEQAKDMNPIISIVINCYQAQAALDQQLASWSKFGPAVLQQLEFVIVDDGSNPAIKVDRAQLPADMRLVLARIEQDIPWNMPGARNLGALLARGEFLLLYDIDHFLTESAFERLLINRPALSATVNYKFSRTQDGEPINSPVNCFLCSREGFWRAGGYDEDFAGYYGHEDSYFLRDWQQHVGPLVLLTDLFFEVRTQYATAGLSRDTGRNSALFQQKLATEQLRARSRLRFAWSVID